MGHENLKVLYGLGLLWLGVMLVLGGYSTPGVLVAGVALAAMPRLAQRDYRRRLEFCPRCKIKRQHLAVVTSQEVWICSRCGGKAMSGPKQGEAKAVSPEPNSVP